MYIARQPIFNTNMQVYSYELLFRSSIDSSNFGLSSRKSATATVLAGVFEQGMDLITGNKKAFVNFDDEMLLSDVKFVLDSSSLAIEILETVKITPEIISRIKKLKKSGYWIVLDDFENDYDTYPLVEYANIIKFDLLKTPLETLGEDVKKALRDKKIILAEKVETQEVFLLAKEMGFHLFQGYFFQKPYIVGKSEQKVSSTAQYTMILSELEKEEPSYRELSRIFESNIDLAYKVLRLAGNKRFEENVDSIKRALTYIGLNDLKFWVSMLMMKEVRGNKPSELVRISLIRAKLAEGLAKNRIFNTNPSESFMLGMFSVIDALLDKQMNEVVEQLPFSQPLKKALLGEGGDLNTLIDFIRQYEDGSFDKNFEHILSDKDLMFKVSSAYCNAVQWATKTFESIDGV